MNIKINGRDYSFNADINNELKLETNKNYLFELSYLSAIALTGEKSQEFLQGQVTCDVNKVSPRQMRQGAMCNLKGRVLTLMDVAFMQGKLQIILPQDLLDNTVERLTKYARFSGVSLSHNDSLHFFGIYLQNHNDILPFTIPREQNDVVEHKGSYIYKLNDDFYLLAAPNDEIDTARSAFIGCNQYRGALAWHILQLKNKLAEIYPTTSGEYTAHRMGLNLSGHIDFNKGCYKGQEIIARTHYRAKLKQELVCFIDTSNAELSSGLEIIDNDANSIGVVLDYAPLGDDKSLLLASVNIDREAELFLQGYSKLQYL